MSCRVNLNLREARKRRFFPFNQAYQFLSKFEHEPILRSPIRMLQKATTIADFSGAFRRLRFTVMSC